MCSCGSRAGLSQSNSRSTRDRVETAPTLCAHCSPSRGTSSPVAMRLPGGVALRCRVSVPSRLTDCKRACRGSHSPKQPLLARSSTLPAKWCDTKVRVAIGAWHGVRLSRTASPVRAASDSRLGAGALYASLKVGSYSTSNSTVQL